MTDEEYEDFVEPERLPSGVEVFVARQPIFDRDKKVVSYELLFRGGIENAMPDVDGDAATAKVLATVFFNLGLDKLSARRPVAINFTQGLLEKEVPLLLPAGTTIVEVMPDVLPTEKLVNCCMQLANSDYQLVLDDYHDNDPRESLLQYADAIKINVLDTEPEIIKTLARHGARQGKRLIAGKVETADDFERCRALGFDEFQGYFFSKPRVFTGTDLSATKLTLMQMLVEVNRREFDFDRLEAMILGDVATSFKLLRYMNSSLFKRPREVKSVRQAMVLLGQSEIRRFLSLIVTSTLAGDKPGELMRDACIKARFGALIARGRRGGCTEDEMFTTGLFSNIDAILDQPMDELLRKLPLQRSINEALLDGAGEMGALLMLMNAYMRGRWTQVAVLAEKYRVHEASLHEFYREACDWADELV